MKKYIILLVWAAFSLTATAQSEKSGLGLAVGATASTNGVGGQVIASLGNRLGLRVGYEQIDRSFPDAFQYTISDIPLNISPSWKAGGFSAMVDLYLLRGFFVSGGIINTDFDLAARLMSAESMMVGEIEYSPEDIGELSLSIKPLEKMSPYVSVGFGRNIARKSGLSMSLELGAILAKGYDIQVTGTNMFAGNSDNESINNLVATLNSFDWSGVIPMVKISIAYRIL